MIVAGVDFSEASARAADVAALLAKRAGAPLVIAHVRPRPDAGPEGERDHERSRRRLDEEVARVAQSGVSPQAKLVFGEEEDALVELARAGADLVVVGAVGRRGEGPWKLGRTAERIAETSPVPVLVVRDPERLTAWARGEAPLKAVLGVDFTQSSDAALRFAGTLRKLAPCDVVAMHLFWPPEERERLGLRGPVTVFDQNAELEALVTRDVKARVGELPGEGEVRIRTGLGLGRLSDHLIRWAEQEHADLLVVGRHPRSALARLWHGSVSQGALHHATMSVACVPLPKAAAAERTAVAPWRHVLVAVDLSPISARAVAQACAAAAPGKVVTLLHVMPPAEAGATNAKLQAQLRPKLEALFPADAEARGLLLRLEFAESAAVPKAICQAAERLGADAVCVAARSRGGLTRSLLGSVSSEVLRLSARPVLVVTPPPEG